MTTSFDSRAGLEVWLDTLLENIRKQGPDLTSRQMAILLTIYLSPPPHTVRGLAKNLNVTKPVVTRALDTMSNLGFVRRKKDEEDKRNILVQRTVKGAVFLSEFSELISKAESRTINNNSNKQ